MARLRMNVKQWQRIQPVIPDEKPGGRPPVTPGQTHESTVFDVILENADKNLLDGKGAPVSWPVRLAGDKGYRADWIDTCLMELDILPVIPSKSNEHRDARPIPFDGESYRKRNIFELAALMIMFTSRAHCRAHSRWQSLWKR